MLRRIFARTFEPYVAMMADYIYTGEFSDPFQEFFIVKDEQGLKFVQDIR